MAKAETGPDLAALEAEVAALKARLAEMLEGGRTAAGTLLDEDQKAKLAEASARAEAARVEIEAQVRAHPVAALAIAFGLGVVLARAMR